MYQELPFKTFAFVYGAGFFLALLTFNPLLTLVAWSVLLFLFFRLWNFSVPPILFFALAYQWLSISIKVLYGDFKQVELNLLPSTYYSPNQVESAFILSSIGLVVFAYALSFFKIKIDLNLIKETFQSYDIKKVIAGYILISLFFSGLQSFRWVIPGLSEALSNLLLVKWGFLIILVFLARLNKSNSGIIYLIILCEIILSFVSYFSSFKDFIFYILIGSLWGLQNLKLRYIPVIASVIGIVFYFGILWTAVKADYRTFLSGGREVQKVTVNTGDALGEFFFLVSSVDERKMDESIYDLVDRIGYLDFFSLVIENVPNSTPHEGGEVWSAAFTHILKPRILFPDKPSIDDSEHTRKYAGVMVANQQMGASHSLGYMVDAYIDFGPAFMFIPIFLFGLFAGYIYRNILLKSYNLFWGIILSTPLFSLLSLFERNSIKMVAQLIMYFLVVWAFRTFVIPKIDHYLRASN